MKSMTGGREATGMHDESKRLKIAYLSAEDPESKRSWSGTTYYMAQALRRHCGDVYYLGPINSLERRLAWRLSKGIYLLFNKNIVHERLLLVARKHAKVAAQRLTGQSFDVIFAPISAGEVALLETDIPIVLAEDATFTAMHNYYPSCSNLLRWSEREGYLVQEMAYKKAQALLYPSHWAANSAIQDCGVNAQKVHVVPFGANLDDIPSKEVVLRRRKSDRCRLLLIGMDWERKGGPIAFETLQRLEELGIQTELTVCGSVPPESCTHERMKVIPSLDKNDERQRKELERLYLDADFLLVPSRQECYGMVFCEASAFGLPSITTDTGGIAGAIIDGVNGFRLPYAARGNEYAQRIAQVYVDDQWYAKLVRSSRETFENRLNWDTWGMMVRDILLKVVSSRRLSIEDTLPERPTKQSNEIAMA
jgi:glycosyltransferase involved in cell wall biosynthesis